MGTRKKAARPRNRPREGKKKPCTDKYTAKREASALSPELKLAVAWTVNIRKRGQRDVGGNAV